MRRPILHLHIGQPKTASSSLQAWALEQRGALVRHGILYPRTGLFHTAHHLIAQCFARPRIGWIPEVDGPPLIAALQREIAASDTPDVLISSEALFYPQIDVEALAQAFAGHELRVFCWLRRQDDWLESALRDNLKTGAVRAMPLQAMLARLENAARYNRIIARWETAFGAANVALQRFPPPAAGAGHGIERALLAQLGHGQLLSLPPARRLNERLSRESLAWLQQLDPGLRITPAHFRLFAALASFSRAAPDAPPHRHMLPPRTRAAIRDRHADGNARLAARHPEARPLFAEAPTADEAWQEWPGLLPERAALIGQYLRARLEDLPAGEARQTHFPPDCLARLPPLAANRSFLRKAMT